MGASFCNLTFIGLDLGKRQENREYICGSSLIFTDLRVKTHYLNSTPSSSALELPNDTDTINFIT